MTETEQKYVHFCESITNLNNAWRILWELANAADPRPVITSAAFRFALIEYAKPYRKSRGLGKSRLRLDAGRVPAAHRALHDRILAARDQSHAHTDIGHLEPTISVTAYGERRIAAYCTNLIDGTEELVHIQDIIQLIEQTLDVMYEEQSKREQQLSPTA